MATTLSFALGFAVMGLEVVLVKTMIQSQDASFLFVVVSMIFFGLAVGAASVGWSKKFAGLVSRYRFLGMGATALLMTGISGHPSTHYKLGILAIFALVAVLSSFIWGALQTILLQESKRPVSMLLASTLGTCAASLLQLALDYWPIDIVRMIFVTALAFISVLAIRERSARTLLGCTLTVLAIAIIWILRQPREDNVQVYSNSFATLRVRKVSPEEPMGIGRRLKKKEGFLRPGYENLDVYEIMRNAQVATIMIDPMREEDLETLKMEEPFEMMALGHKGDLAIVGPGGGQEIMQARLAGYRNITAIEINPLMVQAVHHSRAAYPFSYGADNVKTIVQDARFFFRHLPADTKFDAIMLTNVRYYGSAAALYLSENYVLTAEAFADYVSHLKNDGLILFRTNGATELKRQTHLRSMIAGGIRGLAGEAGQVFTIQVSGKRNRKLIGHQNGYVAVLHRGPLSLARREAIIAGLRAGGVGMISQYNSLTQMADSESLSTDDRPYPNAIGGRSETLEVYYVLAALAVAGSGLLRFRASGRKRDAYMLLGYGFLTGAGYVAFQILAIEKMVFLSGLPGYAPLVTIISACLGSATVYGFFEKVNLARAPWICVLATTALLAIAWGFSAASEWPLPPSYILAAGAAPVFVVSGLLSLSYLMTFQMVRASEPEWMPYFLAMNGFGSLVGGVGGKLICIEAGMSYLFVITAMIYFAVFLLNRHKPA